MMSSARVEDPSFAAWPAPPDNEPAAVYRLIKPQIHCGCDLEPRLIFRDYMIMQSRRTVCIAPSNVCVGASLCSSTHKRTGWEIKCPHRANYNHTHSTAVGAYSQN